MMPALILLACYLLGSVPFGFMVGKVMRGVDIRQFGSGNIGFTNALRILGWGPALTVLIADIGKGVLAVVFARSALDAATLDIGHWSLVIDKEGWAVLGGVLAIVGHNWSVFLKFSGGRGIATGLGVLISLTPKVALSAFGVWLVVLLATRYVSLASLVAAASVPVWMFVFNDPAVFKILGGFLPVLAVTRHIPNIKRLMAGTEHKWGQKVEVKAEGGKEEQRNKDEG